MECRIVSTARELAVKTGKRSVMRCGQGCGYIGARNDTTRPSGHTPDKEVGIKRITVYVSGYPETDTTGMLSPLAAWRQQSEFVSSRQSGRSRDAPTV